MDRHCPLIVAKPARFGEITPSLFCPFPSFTSISAVTIRGRVFSEESFPLRGSNFPV